MRTPALYLAWLTAIVATIGSLYFSEVRMFVPCTLCWYQRILMYPLAYVLGVAAWRGDAGVVRYTLPLAAFGAFVSTFHYLEQMIPGFGFPEVCSGVVPCTVRYIEWFGFVTIPFLALIGFAIIIVSLIVVSRTARPAS